VSPVFLRPSKLDVLAAVVVLTAVGAVAAEPHRWSCRTCPPYFAPDYGYHPTTWRSWPTISETPIESPPKPAQKEEPELAPPPKEEFPEPKPPAPSSKPDVLRPATQPPKKPGEPKEQEVPKQEARHDSQPSKSPYNSWLPSGDSSASTRRP
jgi:hypothetical protein